MDTKTNRLIRYMLALPQKQNSQISQHDTKLGFGIWRIRREAQRSLYFPHPGILAFWPIVLTLGLERGVPMRVSILGVTGRRTVRLPPSILQAPKLTAKTPQTLKQLENNLKQMCAGVYTEQSRLGLMFTVARVLLVLYLSLGKRDSFLHQAHPKVC